MARIREKVLTIAGFDPCGGAGILADIKSFEENRCLGMAIQTAFTIQNDREVKDVFWHANTKIEAQFKALAELHQFKTIKIGICKSLEMVVNIIEWCKLYFPDSEIIWDPILTSSSGFNFVGNLSFKDIPWDDLHWVTPNWIEAKAIFGLEDTSLIERVKDLGIPTKILIKGGHHPSGDMKDYLITKGQVYPFRAKQKVEFGKHGSGCIFSASLAAFVARDFPDIKAVLKTKSYTLRCLQSNTSLLAYHKR